MPRDVGAVHAQVHTLRPRVGGAECVGEVVAIGIDECEVFFGAVHVEGDERESVEGFEGGHVEAVGHEGWLEHGGLALPEKVGPKGKPRDDGEFI